MKYAAKIKDRSIVLLTLFLLFTAYMVLTKVDVISGIYSNVYPQSYFELVNHAETGSEKLLVLDGKYKHEEFREMYDRVVSRYNQSNQK